MRDEYHTGKEEKMSDNVILDQQLQQLQQQQLKTINDSDENLPEIIQSDSDVPTPIFRPNASENNDAEEQTKVKEITQTQSQSQGTANNTASHANYAAAVHNSSGTGATAQSTISQSTNSQDMEHNPHLLQLYDNDDDDIEGNDNGDNDNHSEHTNETREKTKHEKTPSSLDKLVIDSARPSFQKMVSDTKLTDDLEGASSPYSPSCRSVESQVPIVRNLDLESDSTTCGGTIHNFDDDEDVDGNDGNDNDGTNGFAHANPKFSQSEEQNPNRLSHMKKKKSDRSVGSSISTSSNTPFKIKSTDTGKTYNIRDLEIAQLDDDDEILEVKYTLYPSKYDLIELHKRRIKAIQNGDTLGDEVDESEVSGLFSPIRSSRKVISKSTKATGRVVAKASRTLSKGLLMNKSKSDEGGTIAGRKDSLLEPFPNTSFHNETIEEGLDERESKASTGENENSQVEKKTGKKNDKNQQTKSRRQRKSNRTPQVPIPKNTLHVKCTNKSRNVSDFNPVLLITTLAKAHDAPILVSSFSKDGNYLATACANGELKIWQVAPNREQMKKLKRKEWLHEKDSVWKGSWNSGDGNGNEGEENALATVKSEFDALGTEIQFILPVPIQSFSEHKKEIVDISWSNTGFLLSASIDHSVRLWHPTRPDSLHLFNHPSGVTSVSFHPSEDRYFLSGGYDKRIRIWNIPDGRVVGFAQTSDIISTASYQPDGMRVAAGLADGKVIFFSVHGTELKYFTETFCKNNGQKQGKMVTGLAYKDLHNLSVNNVDSPKSSSERSLGRSDGSKENKKTKLKKATNYMKNLRKKKKTLAQVLITSKDSRLRLLGLNDLCMVRKYKGHVNTSWKLKARFSESGKFIIIGTEQGKCVIWNTATRRNPLNVNVSGLNKYDKEKAFESFEATKPTKDNPPVVTEALFAPRKSTKNAILNCGLFPSLTNLNHIKHDFSSAIIVTCDYSGTIRVFLRQSSFDAVVHAAGPEGYKEYKS